MGEGWQHYNSSKNVNFQSRQVLRQVKPNNRIPKYRGKFSSFLEMFRLCLCAGVCLCSAFVKVDAYKQEHKGLDTNGDL